MPLAPRQPGRVAKKKIHPPSPRRSGEKVAKPDEGRDGRASIPLRLRGMVRVGAQVAAIDGTNGDSRNGITEGSYGHFSGWGGNWRDRNDCVLPQNQAWRRADK